MRPGLTYIEINGLSYSRIQEFELIPGFRYLSAPDMRWFESGPLAHAGLQGEDWHEWSLVELGSEAVAVATALGLPIVMVSWESPWHATASSRDASASKEVRFDFSAYDPMTREPVLDAFMSNVAARGLEPVEIEPNVWAVYVEPATFIGLVTTRRAIFELARYFVLASRRQYRNPNFDYGALPPGAGWGHYEITAWRGNPQEWWVAPQDEVSPHHIEALRDDFMPTSKELKAPDSGSWVRAGHGVQPDRDAEWIKRSKRSTTGKRRQTGARSRAKKSANAGRQDTTPFLGIPVLSDGAEVGVMLYPMAPINYARLADYADSLVFATRLGLPETLIELVFADKPDGLPGAPYVLEERFARLTAQCHLLHEGERVDETALYNLMSSGVPLRFDQISTCPANEWALGFMRGLHTFRYLADGVQHVSFEWEERNPDFPESYNTTSVDWEDIVKLFGPPPLDNRQVSRAGVGGRR